MSILAGVVVLAVLMGLAAYLTGLVLAVRLLAQGAAGRAGPIEPQLGALLLVGIGGLLVETTLVAGGLAADRQTDLIRLRGSLTPLETRCIFTKPASPGSSGPWRRRSAPGPAPTGSRRTCASNSGTCGGSGPASRSRIAECHPPSVGQRVSLGT